MPARNCLDYSASSPMTKKKSLTARTPRRRRRIRRADVVVVVGVVCRNEIVQDGVGEGDVLQGAKERPPAGLDVHPVALDELADAGHDLEADICGVLQLSLTLLVAVKRSSFFSVQCLKSASLG
jgi:hypothetical protein